MVQCSAQERAFEGDEIQAANLSPKPMMLGLNLQELVEASGCRVQFEMKWKLGVCRDIYIHRVSGIGLTCWSLVGTEGLD